MIRGQVNSRNEAVVRLRLRGKGGVEIEVDAVVDTGFTAALTLSSSTITALNLVPVMKSAMVLADGRGGLFDIYPVQVLWDGNWQQVLASALGGDVLIGMSLLAGHALFIEVKPTGSVVIEPLP
jgi:clan AA aspartic protease